MEKRRETNRTERWKKQRRKLIWMYSGLGLMAVLVIAAVLSLTRGLFWGEGASQQGLAESGLDQGYRPSDGFIEEPTAEEVEAFYENTVFIGDSVVVGFGNYLKALQTDCLSNPEVVASVGYSLEEALLPDGECSRHPVYEGEQMTIFEATSRIQPEKVVLSFGLNDLNMNTVPEIVENYGTVAERLREIDPDIQIYVISCSWVFEGRESQTLNNENIRELNSQVSAFCSENQIGYINMAPYLADENGCLYSGYTSDFYIHQNAYAYQTWVQLLRRYAYWQLSGKEAPEEMFPITRPDPVTDIPDETLSPTEPIVIQPDNTVPAPLPAEEETEAPETTEPQTAPATEPPTSEAETNPPETTVPATTAAPETTTAAPETAPAETTEAPTAAQTETPAPESSAQGV